MIPKNWTPQFGDVLQTRYKSGNPSGTYYVLLSHVYYQDEIACVDVLALNDTVVAYRVKPLLPLFDDNGSNCALLDPTDTAKKALSIQIAQQIHSLREHATRLESTLNQFKEYAAL